MAEIHQLPIMQTASAICKTCGHTWKLSAQNNHVECESCRRNRDPMSRFWGYLGTLAAYPLDDMLDALDDDFMDGSVSFEESDLIDTMMHTPRDIMRAASMFNLCVEVDDPDKVRVLVRTMQWCGLLNSKQAVDLLFLTGAGE